MDQSEVKHLKVEHEPAQLDAESRLLLKAASWLEKNGHCQQGAGYSSGPGCVWMAIKTVSDAEGVDYRQPLYKLICSIAPRRFIEWNNSTPTADVIARLRALAVSG